MKKFAISEFWGSEAAKAVLLGQKLEDENRAQEVALLAGRLLRAPVGIEIRKVARERIAELSEILLREVDYRQTQEAAEEVLKVFREGPDAGLARALLWLRDDAESERTCLAYLRMHFLKEEGGLSDAAVWSSGEINDWCKEFDQRVKLAEKWMMRKLIREEGVIPSVAALRELGGCAPPWWICLVL